MGRNMGYADFCKRKPTVMSDGQPTKPNWAEKTSAISNVLQNIQLQELHSTAAGDRCDAG